MQEQKVTESIRQSVKELLECPWVVDELRMGDFGDGRLRNRFLVIADRLAKQPGRSICECGEDWGLVKSAYRFFDNERVTSAKVLEPHKQKTIRRASSHSGKVLVIQDTTVLNYSNLKSSDDLGNIGRNKHAQGLLVHTSLALGESGIPLGIVGQKIWSRESCREQLDKNVINRLPIEEKESFKWLESMRLYNKGMAKSDYITVCDREAHIYEFFADAESLDAQVLVRAKQPDFMGSGLYKTVIEDRPVACTYAIEVPNEERENLRLARVELRFGKLVVQRPARLKDNLEFDKGQITMHFVSLKEQSAPKGQTPISWLLLTNLPVSSIKKAKKIIKWYRLRWQVEILFRILKSGCKIEDLLLRKNCRREPYITLQTIIAWRILLMVSYKRACPDETATTIFTQAECDALVSNAHNQLVRKSRIKVGAAIKMLADLGGYLGRKKDPQPGPAVIWRGWQRLQDLTSMLVLAQKATTDAKT